MSLELKEQTMPFQDMSLSDDAYKSLIIDNYYQTSEKFYGRCISKKVGSFYFARTPKIYYLITFENANITTVYKFINSEHDYNNPKLTKILFTETDELQSVMFSPHDKRGGAKRKSSRKNPKKKTRRNRRKSVRHNRRR
jgi:hypothetical protein